MHQREHTAETELPVAETDGDVDENGNQGHDDSPDGITEEFRSNGGLHLLVALDADGTCIGFGEVGVRDLILEERLQGFVQHLVALLFCLGGVVFHLVVDGDADLVVVTEGLHLRAAAEHVSDGLAHGRGVHILVEAHHIVTTAGEVDTRIQAEGAEGDDHHKDKGAGQRIEHLLHTQEVEVGVGHRIESGLVAETEFFAACHTCFENHTGNEDGGEHGRKDTDNQRGGKTLDRTGTEHVEDDTGDEGGDVTVDDGGVGVLVTVLHSEALSFAGTHLLTDTLIDNHVGVDGHTEGQHKTGDTGQGEDGAEGGQHTDDEEHVAEQGQVSHKTGTVVIEQHIDHHEDECDQEGEHTFVDGFLTEARAHDFGSDDVHADFEVTGVQHSGQVLGLIDGEVTGNLGAAVGDFALDGRVGIDGFIKDDSDVGVALGGTVVDGVLGDALPFSGGIVLH